MSRLARRFLLALTACVPITAAPGHAADEYTVPPGFTVERASSVSHSILSLALDGAGRAIVGTEDVGVLVMTDVDGDGFFESVEPLIVELERAQGLCIAGGELFAVAAGPAGGGRKQSGLWRLALEGGRVASRELVLPIDDDDEHGAHAVVAGPGGELYLAVGDHARIATEPAAPWPHPPIRDGALLPPIADPNGHGRRTRFPYGFIARVDPRSGEWRYHSVGYRNHYDLAFTTAGELLTVDSDMEWDVGLPWYRPVRVLACVEGADYGSRRGSATRPEHHLDVEPGLLALGRGSPTGVCVYEGSAFPHSLRGALLMGDWSLARIVAIHFESGTARAEVLVQAQGAMNVTDLAVAADGSVLFTTGGRGTSGALLRFAYTGDVGAPRDPSQAPAIVRPAGKAARRRVAELGSLELGAALERLEPELAGDPAASLADTLRLLELALLTDADRTHPALTRIAERALALFPSGDLLADRELAVVLAHLRPEGAVDALVAALSSDVPREDRIHYAYCLRTLPGGWSLDASARVFGFLEQAATWSGGGSYAGYLDAMRTALVDPLTTDDALALLERGALGPETVARFVARKSPRRAGELVPALRGAFDELEEEGPAGVERQKRILRSLIGARVRELVPWLRNVQATKTALATDALRVLAPFGAPEDWELFVRGLTFGGGGLLKACTRALLASDRKPERAPYFRAVLDAARRVGPPSGYHHLRVLEHWTGRLEGPRDAKAWVGTLQSWEAWFTETFPGYRAPERVADDASGPSWDQAAVATFLERTAGRPGSAARGAEVFTRTTCPTCHTFAGVGSGWGPDLTGVTQRFKTDELLEALWDPSRVIADRYRMTVVATEDGLIQEGRAVSETDEVLVLLDASGEELELNQAEITGRRLSEVSAMPEALLEGASLEELKDLFAYLASDGRIDEVEGRGAPWIDLLSPAERGSWRGDFSLWSVEDDGTLVGSAESLDEGAYLVYDRSFDDFELEFDVRLRAGNSGVQYRSRLEPGRAEPIGYQADVGQRYWGSLYTTDGRGLLAGPEEPTWKGAVDRTGWNHYYVRVEGDRHRVEINGVPMVDTRDSAHSTGVLALQLHERMEMTVRFRRLRVRPLDV